MPDPKPTGPRTNRARTPRAASGTSASAGTVALPRAALLGLLGALLVLLVLTLVFGVRSCNLARQVEELTPHEWVCPYDWNNLATQGNGLLAYIEDGTVVSEAGVDVSEYDGAIDWAAVKASGVDFAMVRVGYRGYGAGSIVLDPYFAANVAGAKEAGLKVGAYFFSQAVTEEEAREEARFVIDQLAAAGVALEYPVAFDEEPITNGDVARTDGITGEQLTKNALAFCQEIEKAGYTAVIYGNQHDLSKLDLDGALADYPVWLAEYQTSTPTAQTDYVMWQYTENGTVDGIPTTAGWVDLNIMFHAR